MKVAIVAVGRMKSGPERDLAARYIERFARAGSALGLEFSAMREIAESRAASAQARRAEESGRLSDLVPEATLCLLDEHGRDLTSLELAEWLAHRRDNGTRNLAFVIGGADGVDPALRERAELKLAFGRQTWPHQFVRIMLAEQLYRVATILSGHPYHRA